MSNYNEKTVEELRDEATKRDLEGRSKLTSKDALVRALEEDDAKSADTDEARPATGAASEASDASDSEVASNLSSEGQEALAEMGEDSAAAEEADLALDASGPLHLESPSERIMTGAVSEEHAKEQEELLAGDDDLHGDVTEAGEAGQDRSAERKAQEDVIDFPPPVGERERRASNADGDRRPRLFEQKGQMYTDGLSGLADSNLERAYEIPELLQSNNPAIRAAGDESVSEAAREEKTDEERKLADNVKAREDS